MTRDELNEFVPGSKHFRWREVLYLPRWKIWHDPTINEKFNLTYIVHRAELIREILGVPLDITSGIRTPEYNKLIGGAKWSAHIEGRALDFVARGIRADTVRKVLLPHLDDLSIRMENLPDAAWVHIDSRSVGPDGRFFKPQT